MNRFVALALVLLSFALAGCRRAPRLRDFAPFDVKLLPHTPVRMQNTGETCWVYAMLSLLESDALRCGDSLPLSAAYVVRGVLCDSLAVVDRRRPLSLRGTGHTFLRAAARYGLMPEALFPSAVYSFSPRRTFTPATPVSASVSRLDSLFGRPPAAFYLDGARYTPAEFGRMVAGEDAYEAFTSFDDRPYGEQVALALPDGRCDDLFHNLPLDAWVDSLDATLARGQTVAWEGDISEPGYDMKRGLATLPADVRVTPRLRSASFAHGLTTDDHMLHIVGTAVSRATGRRFYVAKNSLGEVGALRGYILLSADYVRLKTIAFYRRKP